MIKIGEKQTLKIVKKVDFGVYLSENSGANETDEEEKVLLPIKQVPETAQVGDEMEVFIYRDSKDRIIATTNEPLLLKGQVKLLKVAQMGKFGAFLDWGLEKDLMLPFKEQRGRVNPGDEVLVSLYVDKSNRLCATMNVYENLKTDSPYKKGDHVVGRVYELSDNFGAFVAVDNCYSALIPKKEQYGSMSQMYFDGVAMDGVEKPAALNESEIEVLQNAYPKQTPSPAPNGEIELKGTTLVLFAETALRFGFNLGIKNAETSDMYKMSDFTFEAYNLSESSENPISSEKTRVGFYDNVDYFDIRNITPDKLDDNYRIVVKQNGNIVLIMEYSPFTYINRKLQSTGEDEQTTKLKDVVTSIYRYNKAAEAYVAQ